MPLREIMLNLYIAADTHALAILLGSLLWAIGGTLLARVSKAGKTDSDGRLIASIVIGGALIWLVVGVLALAIAHVGYKKGLLDANILLLLSPIACLCASMVGIHWVFPLNELATIRTLRDIAVFALACTASMWLLSQFRGWGIVFLGGLGDLLLIGAFAVAFLRVLYRRAFTA
ncbi:MAG: hypothetical protein IPG34_03165 [Rhodocyclaceae bacterium]|nr:hypothetical protein [Rhodocyclaceae bacterium]